MFGGFKVHRPVFVIPTRLEELNQVSGGHDLDAE